MPRRHPLSEDTTVHHRATTPPDHSTTGKRTGSDWSRGTLLRGVGTRLYDHVQPGAPDLDLPPSWPVTKVSSAPGMHRAAHTVACTRLSLLA